MPSTIFTDYKVISPNNKDVISVLKMLEGVKDSDIISFALGLVEEPAPSADDTCTSNEEWVRKGIADGRLVGVTVAARLIGTKPRTLKTNTNGQYPPPIAVDSATQNRRLWDAKVCRNWDSPSNKKLDTTTAVP